MEEIKAIIDIIELQRNLDSLLNSKIDAVIQMVLTLEERIEILESK